MFLAGIAVATIIIGFVVMLKKAKSMIFGKKELPQILACRYKVTKKRVYGISAARGNIATYYIDCKDSEGQIVEFCVKEWQYYDIQQNEYIWVIHKNGKLIEIGRCSEEDDK